MSSTDLGLLLDTCAVVWLAQGELPSGVMSHVKLALFFNDVFISPISAWEIGMLCSSRGGKPPLQLLPDAKSWFTAVMARPGIEGVSLTADIAIASTQLPGALHRDPADRMLIATARALDLTLVTRDEKILEYGRQGFVRALPC